ncbi:MAG: pyrrolysine--tRNA(Pyl) ligase large subunit [Deltaproteobacteria bacterium]|nr:pyrrolysine--tRNA(Pyl) ligase large subunit [Deltaproteobacteria bacterium]
MNNGWTLEQERRLGDLDADEADLGRTFPSPAERDRAFQALEKEMARAAADGLRRHLAGGGRPFLAELREKLAAALVAAGFTEVETPLIVSRSHLERMGLDSDHSLNRQIFWLDRNKALRPMLAPNLYYLLVDLVRLAPHPVSIFEIGPCLRKETQGAKHSAEFTMLNLVEMGLPLAGRRERIRMLAELVLEAAGLPAADCRLTAADSGVYGETLDVESPDGLELASTAMGPHPLDANWGFVDMPWVGLGFGLERLVMARAAREGRSLSPARAGRGLGWLAGFRLNL